MIKSTTASIFSVTVAGKTRRFFTKRAAIRWCARQRYKEKYQLYRCACSIEEGRCDYCLDESHRHRVMARYTMWLLKYAEVSVCA